MGTRDTSDLLSNYLLTTEFRFDAMLCSYLDNENSDLGHIKCSRRLHFARGSQVPIPGIKYKLSHVSILPRNRQDSTEYMKIMNFLEKSVYLKKTSFKTQKHTKLLTRLAHRRLLFQVFDKVDLYLTRPAWGMTFIPISPLVWLKQVIEQPVASSVSYVSDLGANPN